MLYLLLKIEQLAEEVAQTVWQSILRLRWRGFLLLVLKNLRQDAPKILVKITNANSLTLNAKYSMQLATVLSEDGGSSRYSTLIPKY